jgi:hypothetical protein
MLRDHLLRKIVQQIKANKQINEFNNAHNMSLALASFSAELPCILSSVFLEVP